jgi:membrane fusion protein, heavy metal efflux system
VWIDLSVFQKDLVSIRKGQGVVIASDTALPEASGEIAYMGPIVGEETRTALARVVLPNDGGMWRPGMFVTARIAVNDVSVPVAVPKSALVTIDGQTKVFLANDDAFEPVTVKVGRADATQVEILDGLASGTAYVTQGGFHLKAELDKAAFAHSGHAH